MLARLATATLILTFVCAAPSPAIAQGDWSVKRNPFDAGTIRRYKAILKRRPHDSSALASLARMYRKYRTIGKLVGEYEAALAKKPKDHGTLVILARLEANRGDKDKSAAYWEQAVAVNPKDGSSSLALGELYFRSSKLKDARRIYDQALSRSPSKKNQKRILHKLAILAENTGDIDGAVAYFERYFKLAPKDVQARLELGDVLLKHERYKKAIEIFRSTESALKRDPMRRLEVISRLGDALEGSGDLDGAVREYRRAMSLTRRGYYIRKELTARVIDIYRRRQELGELTKYYEGKWPASKRSHFEWDTMARLYEEIGNQEKAVQAYRRATKKAPFELDTHRRLIRLLETTGRENDALKQYEVVIRIAPGEPRFQLELAERYYRRGKRKKALALLRRLEGRFGGDAGVHSALADIYARWGEEDLALKAHVRLVRIEPSEVTHLVNLGEQYFQKGDKKKAIATWKRIIARKTPENLARLGQVYADHDMTGPALEMYSKAIRLKPRSAKLYRGRAVVHERRKDWRKAVTDWQTVYNLQPKKASAKAPKAEARRRIVALLKRSGRRSLTSRVVTWKRAFKSGDIDAGYFLVEAALRQGNLADARRTLEQLIRINGKDTDAMLALVKVHRGLQRYDDAINLLLQLVKLMPGRERDFYNQVAELKTRLNKDKEAIFYAQKALDKAPKDPVAYEQLAERYLEMQQYEKAIVALEKTIELAPRNFRAHFSLARLYRNTHRLAEAAGLYRRILKRSTDDEILYKAGRQAIALEELTRSLGKLERVISPLAFTFGHKEVYRRILVELYARHVPALVTKTRSGKAADRKKAMSELTRLGTHGLKPLLEALADERDPGQRRIAVSVLGFVGNRGAAAPLVQLARQEGKARSNPRARGLPSQELDWDLRIEALIAAGRLADPRTIPDLLELTKHSEVAMREAATFALGMTRDRRAIKPLKAALDDKRPSVQALACLGLAQIGESRATPRIVDIVGERNRYDSVRAACTYALGVIGDRSAEPVLISVLGQGNDEAQRLSAWALGTMGSKKAVPALLGAYFGRRAPLRSAIAWALPRAASGKRIANNAQRFMDYPIRSGKFDVTRSIRELPGPLPKSIISATLLSKHQANITEALLSSLTRHRDLVHRVLAELDTHPDRLALGALTSSATDRELGSLLSGVGNAITPTVATLAQHRDPVVRRHALSVLAKIGGPNVYGPLARALKAKSLELRIVAMEAIAPLMRQDSRGAKRLGADLRASLQARDWREQVAAATAMGKYGRGADRKALIAAVQNRDRKAFVRQAAATSLGRLGAKSAISALDRAARDPSRAVQEQAVLALRAIGGPQARAALKSINRDSTVSASARALARSSVRVRKK